MRKLVGVEPASKNVEIYQELCDGCGVLAKEAEFGLLVHVAIEVNYGEEYGGRDEYDYCNQCLLFRAALLVAAGSTAELIALPEEHTNDRDN